MSQTSAGIQRYQFPDGTIDCARYRVENYTGKVIGYHKTWSSAVKTASSMHGCPDEIVEGKPVKVSIYHDPCRLYVG